MIAKGICYLILCEAGFSKKLAFSYLEDLSSEFFVQYGNRVNSVSRPYAFIEFGMSLLHDITLLFFIHCALLPEEGYFDGCFFEYFNCCTVYTYVKIIFMLSSKN